MKPQAIYKSNNFQSFSGRETAASGGKRCRYFTESTFVNHSFSSFKNYVCVLISTEWTVLIRSGYSFVGVEVKV